MRNTLEATYDGLVFRPDETVELEPNTKLEITVKVKKMSEEKSKSFLRTASSLKLKGPKDFSENLDDYLNGEASRDRTSRLLRIRFIS